MRPVLGSYHHLAIALSLGLFLVLALALNVASSAPLDTDPFVRTADGISVYLGVMPAAIVRGHPQGHPESTMHGGPPRSSIQRHIVVALFDARTFERIVDAEITATVEGVGHIGRTTKKLEPMDIAGAQTFGGYFPFEGRDRFTIHLDIKTTRQARPTVVEFSYET